MLRMNKQYNKLYNILFKVKIQRKQFQKLLFFILGIWEVSFCLDDVNNFLVFILIIFITMLIRAFSLANLINKIKIDVIIQKSRQGGQGWVLKCAVSNSQNLTNSLSLNLSLSLSLTHIHTHTHSSIYLLLTLNDIILRESFQVGQVRLIKWFP